MDQTPPRLPAPNADKLIFDEFHDLMHPIWACGDLYGGWRRHLALWWEFKAEPEIRRLTVCRLGPFARHQWAVGFVRDPDDDTMMMFDRVHCRHCVADADTATATAVLVDMERRDEERRQRRQRNA